MLSKPKAISKLEAQREQIPHLKTLPSNSPEFKKWYRDTEIAIQNVFGEDTRHIKDFTSIMYTLSSAWNNTPDSAFQKAYRDGLSEADSILDSFIDEICEYWSDEPVEVLERDKILLVRKICERFHLVVRSLRSRYSDRDTLNVEDEYDVQDLLRALLILEFDDIRPEEWAPSYAGSASRLDFLLWEDAIVIETKKTRKGLATKQIGEQLIIDIKRYQSHPKCKMLICFVYDPEGRIANPKGLENDLSGTHGDLPVQVIIGPKGL